MPQKLLGIEWETMSETVKNLKVDISNILHKAQIAREREKKEYKLNFLSPCLS